MSSHVIATCSSAASSPIASESPGMPMASGRPDSRMSVEPSSFDAASTSKKKKIQKTPTILRLEPGTTKENPLPKTVKLGGQPVAHGASSSVDQESQKNTEATWDHYLHISLDTSHYMEAVFSMVRKIYGTQPGDPMEYLNVNIWLFGECS